MVIVNTCCVTREAERKSRQRFRHARRAFPDHHIIVTGCDCRLDPDAYAGCDEIVDIDRRNLEIAGIFPEPARARYFLKVQDGCDEPCTYCIVPRIRAKVCDKTWPDIRAEVDWAVAQGFPEIVLVGANLGLYGRDRDAGLAGLLEQLAAVPDLPRIRLSSIEPRFVNRRLIQALTRLPRCEHFHLAIQSADDAVLKAMGRTYTRVDLESALGMLVTAFPDALIGADIIVGFPAEDDLSFNATADFVAGQENLVHLHVFPYSPRPQTRAGHLGDPIPRAVKRQRLVHLRGLAREKHEAFRRRFIGRILKAVVIRRDPPWIRALTGNYLTIHVPAPAPEARLVRVEIERVEAERTIGRVITT